MNRPTYRASLFAFFVMLLMLFTGCADDSSSGNGQNSVAGSDNQGGADSTGGTTAGKSSSKGGSSSAGGSSSSTKAEPAGGTTSAGGATAIGDTTGNAGATAVGGTSSVGGATAAGGTTAVSNVVVSLNEIAYTFETPDLTHALTATVTGSTTTTVTWASSNTYIATVSATGVVTSVSGGTATITATATADTTKSAAATVTVSEPNRPKATTYVDAKSITSGPVNILMCGDSLMRTYIANADDQTGWGQILSEFLTTDVTVNNTISAGGRSSRSFYNEVIRWNAVKAALAAAQTAGTPTFVFIMFGHNDQKKATDDAGPSYLTFASQNPNGTVAGTYYDYLERYIVETRALGGIPILLTPFVRIDLEGTPATVSAKGQHNITVAYAGEATPRGNYPAAMKAVGAKHDVPVVDTTSWSKTMVDARVAAGTQSYVYIPSDQTHVRKLGALLIAEEAMRSLNAQGILTNYAKTPAAKVMLDPYSRAFGSTPIGTTADRTFRISPYGNVTGTILVTAPSGYTVSTDGATFGATASITCDATYAGSIVTVRFTPTDAVAYNADLTVTHSTLTPEYGNTVPNATAGAISLTGNGKVPVVGDPASATWAMFAGTAIDKSVATVGAVSATAATLTGLVDKNVLNGGARFDVVGGSWPSEVARNETRYVEFAVSVPTGKFTIDTISGGAGSGGGSAIHWDIVYSPTADFASPTALGTNLPGAKDTLVPFNYTDVGVTVLAGQTLYLRVYPYNTATAAATGKSIMVANVVISGVTGS